MYDKKNRILWRGAQIEFDLLDMLYIWFQCIGDTLVTDLERSIVGGFIADSILRNACWKIDLCRNMTKAELYLAAPGKQARD